MMNSHASSRKQTARYLLVLPLALGLLSFSAPKAASAMLTPTAAVVPASEDVEKATTISALPPAALAHIVKQYPGYRLIGVSELRAADGSNLRYKAEIAIGRRPKQVVFTEKGEPVAAVAVEPLYYVDGKLTSKSEVDKLDPKLIESMNVLKGETARKAFGDQAVDGVVVITTKANVNSSAVRTFNQKIEAAAPTKKTDMSKALILLNGKEITEAEMKQIPSSTIKEVRIVNDEDAEKQYGAKGKNGVIIVTTK